MLTRSNKRLNTVRTRYQVDNVAQLAEVQEKRRQTFDARRETISIYHEATQKIDGHSLDTYKLTKTVADNWLNTYHPQKAPKGNIVCLGLVKDEIIYCIMTFRRSRNPQYIAELSRMWTLPGYQVTDGYDILSKLASDLGLYNIVAYIHVPLDDPAQYELIGMQCVKHMQRTKWWMKENSIVSDASMRQKHQRPDKLVQQGWRPVYDSQQLVYEFK